MSYLLDTNIVSELRRGDRTNARVAAWFDGQPARALFLSVVTLGEIRQGIEALRRRDARRARALHRWLAGLAQFYEDRLLYIDGDVADEWGRLRAAHNPPVLDAFLAATARVRRLTLVTRNTSDFNRLDVPLLNPFVSADGA